MALAWSRIPHVSHQDSADITELEAFRKENEAVVGLRGGRLTLTVFAIKAAAASLKAYPEFNASLDEEHEEIVLKHYYHMGMATDTERGLVVPVIQHVDRKSLSELSLELPRVADKARHGRLDQEDVRGGTFTVTNIGSIGGEGFMPIINYPQAAILGLGQARRRAVVMETRRSPQDVVPRLILPLVLAFDHRIADGARAARFLNHVIELLESPAKLMLDL
jgi:pyruvate dehydrogenase E2 component (dihydrolipoamide acetyltransferase)